MSNTQHSQLCFLSMQLMLNFSFFFFFFSILFHFMNLASHCVHAGHFLVAMVVTWLSFFMFAVFPDLSNYFGDNNIVVATLCKK